MLDDEFSAIRTNEKAPDHLAQTSISLSDLINYNITNLESRIKLCDDVYKLATDTNETRFKESDSQFRFFELMYAQMNRQLDQVEKHLDQIPNIIRDLVAKEKKTKKVPDNFVQQSFQDIGEKVTHLDQIIAVQIEKDLAMVKQLRRDLTAARSVEQKNPHYEILSGEITELERTQAQMMDLLGTIQKSKPS